MHQPTGKQKSNIAIDIEFNIEYLTLYLITFDVTYWNQLPVLIIDGEG